MTWDEIVSQALVGTGRRAPQPPEAEGALGTVLAGLDASEPERLLLSAAGAAAVWRRAGWVPPAAASARPEAAGPDPRPRPGPRAEQHLAVILGGTYGQLLTEWLRALERGGMRLPETLLPELLDLGRSNRPLREWLLPVLGTRGRWLAEQNPQWSYAVGDLEDEEGWETGSQDVRQAILAGVRRRDPAKARQMLEAVWDKESTPYRSAFLAVLKDGLSAEDEPFLEGALGNPNKHVREPAADLLARLPGSALARRMEERAAKLLTLSRHMLIQWKLEVTLPGEFDKAWARDGLEQTPPSGVGPKSWWLQQIVSRVPPSYWSRTWNRSPQEILTLAHGVKEHEGLLLEAWTEAAQRYRDRDWAGTVFTHAVRQPNWMLPGTGEDWLAVLPRERLHGLVAEVLRDAGRKGESPVMPLLQSLPGPWTEELGRAFLARLKQFEGDKGPGSNAWRWHSLVQAAGTALPTALLAEAQEGWQEEVLKATYWGKGVEPMLATLQFRHEMLEELTR